MNPSKDNLLYSGSVKDLYAQPGGEIEFHYSDAFSVFDWGRLPDKLENKGRALNILAAHFFEHLQSPKTWENFSASPSALALRKGISILAATSDHVRGEGVQENRVSLPSLFNEIGERLKRQGVVTHYRGVVQNGETVALKDLQSPTDRLRVVGVGVTPPEEREVMGRTVVDYTPTRAAKLPKLIPLEMIFRFGLPKGSSLIEQMERNPEYLRSLPFPSGQLKEIKPGARWDFPLIEMSTKLESRDRRVSFDEALAISGLTADKLQELLLITVWTSAALRAHVEEKGLELWDGKLEFAMDEDGQIILVDAIGPDELRILNTEGVQLSKEFLREFYRGSKWETAVRDAKAEAKRRGTTQWKSLVAERVPSLSVAYAQAGSNIYTVLANHFTGRQWFQDVGDLSELTQTLAAVQGGEASVTAAPEPIQEVSLPKPIVKKETGTRSVLIIGSGAREHALARKLKESPQVRRVTIAPGNDGMEDFDRWKVDGVGPTHFESLAKRAREDRMDLVVIGPDNPLADGIVDSFEKFGLTVFGPRAEAAKIEASKAFAKEVMAAAGVPTARFETFANADTAKAYLGRQDWSKGGWVVKADGLALGKGVVVCDSQAQAEEAVDRLLGVNGRILIEERLSGEEVSWMALCDGETCSLLEPARDYKPLSNENKGPNTGGMGAFSPVPDLKLRDRILKEVFVPTMNELKKRDAAFKGLLYAGLMVDGDRFWVIEFNSRFGDPEAQVLLPRMDVDLYEWMVASARGELEEFPRFIPFKPGFAVCVVAAAPGYPGTPEKGIPLKLMCNGTLKTHYYFAGVKRVIDSKRGETLLTNGGRVFTAIGKGESLEAARDEAYRSLKAIQFDGMQFRTDIAKD